MTPDDLQAARDLVAAATPGPWHWAGNIDNGEPYLATWIPGAGRCQVLSIGGEERKESDPGAESLRSYLRECDYDEAAIEAEVHTWMHDSYGSPVREPRLQFVTDLMCVNAREHVVYEVAPEATSRDDKAVYRADIVDIRHPDARLIAAAPDLITRLLDHVDALAAQVSAVRDLHRKETRWLPYPDAEISFDTREEAEAEDWDYDTDPTPFDLCAACKIVEEGACEGECTRENGYATSIWPCPTIRALDPGAGQ